MEQFDIVKEIIIGEENARRAYELYQLLSSYNAYTNLFIKIENALKGTNINQGNFYSDCYRNQINDLFSLFKSDECLKTSFISQLNNERDMFFLIDENTLLRLSSFDLYYTDIKGASHIDYNLYKINETIAKVYTEMLYCGDPYYYDKHWEEKKGFGIFEKNSLITPSYALTSELEKYHNVDIRDILKIQPIEEIYEKINDAKNIKTKTLMLIK